MKRFTRQVSCPCPKCMKCCCHAVKELKEEANQCVNRTEVGVCHCKTEDVVRFVRAHQTKKI